MAAPESGGLSEAHVSYGSVDESPGFESEGGDAGDVGTASSSDFSPRVGDVEQKSMVRTVHRKLATGFAHLGVVGQKISFTRKGSIGYEQMKSFETELNDFYVMIPVSSVYSYFLFIPPLEKRRYRRACTWVTAFAAWLVLVNFMMQFWLLTEVGKDIMHNHDKRVSRIVRLERRPWYQLARAGEAEECQNKLADTVLCNERGDQVSCAPPSIDILLSWEFLDLDGNGVWERSEAEDPAFREKALCKHNIDPVTSYDAVARYLQSTSDLDSRRDANLDAGSGIHRAYMDWYMGEPLLCLFRDEGMCMNMFSRGIFDEALRQRSYDAMLDVDSALEYCRQLLKVRCPSMLPEGYSVWQELSQQQCGPKHFRNSVYRSPIGDGVSIPMLYVGFEKQYEYRQTQKLSFRAFVVMLLLVFLLKMSFELKSILKCFIWAVDMPIYDDAHDEHSYRNSVTLERGNTLLDTSVVLEAIELKHRVIIFVVTVFRTAIWVYLTYSGITFLTSNINYLGLIFDALSLVFIIEIDELLYETMLRQQLKSDHEKIEPMRLHRKYKLTGMNAVPTDFLCTFALIILTVFIVYEYSVVELDRLQAAMDCACTMDGPSCYEAERFGKAWWDEYWSVRRPEAERAIDTLVGR